MTFCDGCPNVTYNEVTWADFSRLVAVAVDGPNITVQTPVAISGHALYNLDNATVAVAITNPVAANGTFTISNSLPAGTVGAIALFNQNGRVDAIYAFRSTATSISGLKQVRTFGDDPDFQVVSTSLAFVGNGQVRGVIQLRDNSIAFTNGTTQVAVTSPVITQQPQSQTVAQGQSVIFGVTAEGTQPLSYQWLLNNTNISGATNPSYVVASAVPSDDGSYTVVVANAYGSITSAPAILKTINGSEGTLICLDGSPLANCTVTIDFWAGGAPVASAIATTDNAGFFTYTINCSAFSGVQSDRKLVITASCCLNQTWTVPSMCCCGNVGTLVCDDCEVPTVSANKDFQNNTGQAVDDIEWLIQGTYSSVISHYDGPYPTQPNSTFSSFTIVPSGANTLLRWSGGASIPNGGFAHVGFVVPGISLTTLGASWTIGGVFAGCAHQVSVGEGFSHASGEVVFQNTATTCESQVLYVGNISVEWFPTNVPLAELSVNGIRYPLRTDDISSPPVSLSPGVSVPVTIPLPPPGARFAMIRYTVSASLTLTGPGNTIDYQEIQLRPGLQGTCGTGGNLAVNGSFESPVVANNTSTFVSAVPGWNTTDSLGQFEIWAGTAISVPPQDGNQHLEINAHDGDATVSQVINNLSTNCPTTLCFYYTGRFPNPSNNTFQVTLSWPGGTPISATVSPASHAVGGWQLYSITFLPTASPLTISFRGMPADGNSGGPHIDNVSLTQQPPSMTCPADITLSIAGSSAVVNYSVPAVAGGGLAICTPPSGSVFSTGSTLVTCTATNDCGTNACTFSVTVLQVNCPAAGTNWVANGSFEAPQIPDNGFDYVSAVPGWTTDDSQGDFELWSGTSGGSPAFGGILPTDGNQHLEINAHDGNETVSQVIGNLNTNCPATLCFSYTGRFSDPLNNRFEVELSWPGVGSPIVATLSPVSYGVAGWQLSSKTFVPTASPLTIKFHGIPASGNEGGAHIDGVVLTQEQPATLICPADIALSIADSSVIVNYANPIVPNGTFAGCAPPSGSIFSVGTTLVTCAATNDCGGSTCTFNITVLQVLCPTNNSNLAVNGSFETPIVANNTFTWIQPVPGWMTTDSLGEFELWAGAAISIPSKDGNQHLEINAHDADETVSQVVNLTTNCPTTLCFSYTGRFPNPLNNTFEVELSWPAGSPISTSLSPVSHGVAGWQLSSTTFVPTASPLTIKFRGIPADGNEAGAHIDDVFLTQDCPCQPNPVLSIALNGSNIVISWSGSGYRLESTTTLANPSSATVWSNVPGTSSVTLPASGPQKFFRLVCP